MPIIDEDCGEQDEDGVIKGAAQQASNKSLGKYKYFKQKRHDSGTFVPGEFSDSLYDSAVDKMFKRVN